MAGSTRTAAFSEDLLENLDGLGTSTTQVYRWPCALQHAIGRSLVSIRTVRNPLRNTPRTHSVAHPHLVQRLLHRRPEWYVQPHVPVQFFRSLLCSARIPCPDLKLAGRVPPDYGPEQEISTRASITCRRSREVLPKAKVPKLLALAHVLGELDKYSPFRSVALTRTVI